MPSFGAIKSLQARTGCDRATAKAALDAHDDDVEVAAAAIGVTGTASSSASNRKSEDQKKLDAWAAQEQADSLSVTQVEAGDGKNFPENGDTLHMHYRGTLAADGTEFDSSYKRNKPFVFKIGVGSVIKGWDVGVMKMSLGEKATLAISSDYGYGPNGHGPIPPSADLIFEVHLLKIEKARQREAEGNL